MINVNQITAQLARMPDQALQQFAAMHKNDPYTVSLALSESNRRKQMRTASQMPQGEMPKVVDQALAEMMAPQAPAQAMPEDIGIGALPAGNMDFADGGIVGYADGGAVQRFAGAGESLVRSTTGGKDYFLDIPETIRDPSVPYYRLIPNPLAPLAGRKFASREEAVQAYGAAAPSAALGAPQADVFTRPGMANDPRMDPDFQIPDRPKAPVANTGGAGAKEKGIEQLLAPKAPRAASSTAPAAPATAGDFMSQFDAALAKQGDAASPFAAELRNMNVEQRAGLESALEKRKTEQASEMEAMDKGKKERLDKREGELGADKKRNEGLAFLAAAGAMSKSKERGLSGLLATLVSGADTGGKSYAAGIEKIKAAQEKMDEARDRMEELRQNRLNMNSKEVRDAEREILNLANQGNRDQLEARMKTHGENRTLAAAAVKANMDAASAQADRSSREGIALIQERGANARSAAPSASMREAMLLGTGATDAEKYQSGLKKLQELTGDKQGTQLLKLFLDTNATREKNGQDPLTLSQFRQQASSFYAPPAPVNVAPGTKPRS